MRSGRRLPQGPPPAVGWRPVPVLAVRILVVRSLAIWVLALGTAFAAQEDGGRDLAAELGRFVEALTEVRAGSVAARAPLEASAEELRASHGREDAWDVARFYLGLAPDALATGLEREAEFLALRERIVRVGHEGVGESESWRDVRHDVLAELRALERRARQDADVGPRARALALIGWLELDRLERDGDLTDAERAAAEEAVDTSTRASLGLFERIGQVTPRLEPLWVRSRLFRARGERGRARAALVRLDEVARAVGRDEYRERALLGLAELAADVGDVVAVDRLHARVATFRDPRTCWPLARGHAARLLAQDRAETALAFLLANEPPAASDREDWRGLLAGAYLRLGDHDAARRELEFWSGSEFPRLARAALALAEDDPGGALDELDDAATWAGWSAASRTRAASLAGEAWLALGRADRARPLLERALAAARVRELADSDSAGSVVGEWLGIHTLVLLARAYAAEGDALDAAALIESRQSRRLRPDGDEIDASEISRWAMRFERGLVTWAVGAEDSLAIHVSHAGDALAVPLPVGRRELAGAVRRLREAAIANDAARVERLAGELSSTLLPQPLAARLAAKPGGDSATASQPRLLFLLHGPLERLPLALLPLGGIALAERCTPLVLPGLPRDVPGPAGSGDGSLASRHWWFVGSPLDERDGSALLPAAARELAHLSREDPRATVATGGAFVRDALEEALSGADPVHVATHLVPAPDADDGRLAPVGLLLSRGEVFSAADVLRLAPRLPLIVLSACATGEGRYVDAEGLQGLGRAFLEAGTRNVVVTLWPIEDEAARRFALEFHAAIARGARPSAAAAEARAALRAAGRSSADWAAFRLLGRD